MKHRITLQRSDVGKVTMSPVPETYSIDPMHDSYGRRINYLRISLTDVCNLRCVYCMPEDMTFQPRQELMTDEELLFLVRVGASLGVNKIRLTGGEPTIRPNLVELVREIAAVPGIEDLAMTTNAILLDKLAQPLAEAGLRRVNISIDTLDGEKFHNITRWGDIDDVWRGIRAAENAGMTPIKLNCVVVRNFNQEDMIDLARLTLENDWEVRFIEMMPFGDVSDFQKAGVVSEEELRATISAALGPMVLDNEGQLDGEARLYKLEEGVGSLGFISSVTQPFCAGCSRARLTADGRLRLCLLRENEVNLMQPLRGGASDDELKKIITDGIWWKPWGHGLERNVIPMNRVMSEIGG